MAAIACENLTKRFGSVCALGDVSFEVPEGGVLIVLGASGAGKTTLLRVVAGLEVPDAGTVRMNGRAVTGEGAFVAPHLRHLAFVFQRPTLWPHMSALANVTLGAAGLKLPRRERRRRAGEALEKLGLGGRGRALPATLSGGELQRVALARALVSGPRVLLLDEPFAGLDAELRNALVEDLARLRDVEGVSVLWVTHRCEEALGLADALLLLRDGRVEDAGPAETVLAHPRTAFSARFLGDANLIRGLVSRPGRAATVFGEFNCEARAPGAAVLFAVNPDGFAVGADGNPRARVLRARFRGRCFAYLIELGGEQLRIHLRERFAPGDDVPLKVTSVPAEVEAQ